MTPTIRVYLQLKGHLQEPGCCLVVDLMCKDNAKASRHLHRMQQERGRNPLDVKQFMADLGVIHGHIRFRLGQYPWVDEHHPLMLSDFGFVPREHDWSLIDENDELYNELEEDVRCL